MVAGRAARGTRTYAFSMLLPNGAYMVRAGAGVVTGTSANVRVSNAYVVTRFIAR
jgi:hypothetical protein